MSQIAIVSRLEEIDQLPTLPMVLRQVQKVMKNPNSNMAQIAAVIAKDQALASRTIRLVNSAFYGMRNRVTSVHQAIVILGLTTVINLMLGLSVIKIFADSEKKQGFDHDAFWEHAFATAILARELGKKASNPEPDDCFIAGLLHDFGRLVLEQFFHDEFMIAVNKARDENLPLSLAEHQCFGGSHAVIAGFLARRWQLPEVLTACIQFHHGLKHIPPEQAIYKPNVLLVAKANQIANKNHLGNSGEGRAAGDSHFSEINLLPAEEDALVKQVRSELETVRREWQP